MTDGLLAVCISVAVVVLSLAGWLLLGVGLLPPLQGWSSLPSLVAGSSRYPREMSPLL